MTAAIKVPIGPSRGKPITDVSVAELEDACTRVEAKLCSATSDSSITKYKRFVGAARPLLARRKFPTGSYETTEDANRALRDAKEMGHLLAPSEQMAALLPGCALLITAYRVDLKHDLFEDDEQDGHFVPGKPLLDKVARDLNVSWRGTERTDNQRDPYVRSYHAIGSFKQFDASSQAFEGNAGIDLRQGSPLVNRLRERNLRGKNFDVERRREFIDSICDTQARLKACRQLGLKQTYTSKELQRPFFMARLQFTGKTDDPTIKPILAQHVADSFKSSHEALFKKRTG